MVTLGIETSCDETASAVVQNGRLLSNIVTSSIPLHEKYGGVIPEIASRFHIEYINQVVIKALKKAGKKLKDVDLLAVTNAPGLPGSLLVGISFAKTLSYALGIPLINVDHLSAHLFANFLVKHKMRIKFPFIGIVVSGGHTNIFVCKSYDGFSLIGRTKDDAIGEAFDKVAKILRIGYPGGPRIERQAARFRFDNPIDFPRTYLEADSFDFSLSGIKTSVLYHVRDRKMNNREIARVSWSFQEAVFDVLAERMVKACKKFNIHSVLLGGGVISNARLRQKLTGIGKKLNLSIFYPPRELCLDNAAMVAGLGEYIYTKNVDVKNPERRASV